MRQGPFARLRALVLLVVFGAGVAGQAAAAVPMPMAPDAGTAMAVLMGGADGCPGCAGRGSSDNPSKVLAPGCAAAFCFAAVGPAILPQVPAVFCSHDGIFLLTAAERVWGISIRPDLGPPRPSLHA